MTADKLDNINGYISFYFKCLDLLAKSDRKKFKYIVQILALLGLIDLIGVGLIGAIGALAVRGVQSKVAGDRVSHLLYFLNIEELNFQLQVMILSAVAVLFLFLKTILNMFISRRILYFLSDKGTKLSSELLMGVFSQKLIAIQKSSSERFQYSTGFGVWSISLGVLGVGSNMIADATLLIILLTGLLIIDPLLALLTLFIFGFFLIALSYSLKDRSKKLGYQIAELQMLSTKQMNDLLITYRENYVRNSRRFYIDKLSETRATYSKAFAEQTFLPNVSKYLVELLLIIGGTVIAALQFSLRDASNAAAGIALFLAAGSRMVPALLRLHQGYIQINSSIGTAKPAYDLILETKNAKNLSPSSREIPFSHRNFIPEIIMDNVNFKYPNANQNLFNKFSLIVKPGEVIGIVGTSGTGKTTLIDLILGIHEPQSGTVTISGMSPESAIEKWPGSISYIPQNVGLINDTVQNNILLGFSSSESNLTRLEFVINELGLSEMSLQFPHGLQSIVGENGSRLSGGQRQKIGIARAMLTNPSLIILDEATSALDSESEKDIIESIDRMKKGKTILIIAHRLSTIRNADRILYIRNGEILADGSFEYVREVVSDFDRQAKLMGL